MTMTTSSGSGSGSGSGSIINLQEEGWAIVNKAKKDKYMVDLEECWAFIYKAFLQLSSRLEEDVNFEVAADEKVAIYSTVYNMCSHHNQFYERQLYIYNRYEDCIKEYVTFMVLPNLSEQNDNQVLLRELVKRWKIFKAMLRYMNFIFFEYLDRYFTDKYRLPSVREVGIMYFRDLVLGKMGNNVKKAVIVVIDEEQEGEPVRNETLLKDVVAIFVEVHMDFYTNVFEVAMLEHTGDIYSRKPASWFLQNSYTDYMSRVDEYVIRQKEKVARYLPELLDICEQRLFHKLKNALFSHYTTHFVADENSGCLALLREHRYNDILMMGVLFEGVPNGWESIANIFKQHVISEVTPPVKQFEDAVIQNSAGRMDKSLLLKDVSAFVRTVIELHDQYMKYAQQNTAFSRALKEVFEAICNKGIAGSTSAEWLATLCDTVSSNEKLRGDDIIENVVEFVEYIWDKDVFVESYKEKLTRRILLGKSANIDHEQSILSKMKQKCGAQLTSQIAGMLTDWTGSQERQSNFETYLKNNRNIHLGIEFTAAVLTTKFWPTYKCPHINLPPEMVRCVEAFTDYYSAEAQHQKLKWIYSLGSCTIIGKFDRRSIKLIATTCQTAILLLFNASEKLSYSNIKKLLNLAEEEIDGLLYSLACDKYKILLKIPDTTTVTASDDFKINFNFTDKKGKIKLPMPLLSDKKKSSEEDRRFLIYASIVRIMKAKRVLQYKILVSECAQELEKLFKVDFMHIKRRIEALIEREFLERDTKEVNLLRYIP